jgi:pimeloyl-ACP methyl ester carboxylesterase
MNDYAVYLISGIGADKRAFDNLRIEAEQIVHINWLKPEEGDDLRSYCSKLIESTSFDLSRKIVLIGVSFGGIIAQEIAKRIECEKIIIISSVKNCDELPASFRLLQKSKFLKMVPAKLFKYLNSFFASYYFSIEGGYEKKLLKAIIEDIDPFFMKWAIHQMCSWNNNIVHQNILHIHGASDRVFPIENISNAETLSGGHFMIVNKADEVSSLINSQLVSSHA